MDARQKPQRTPPAGNGDGWHVAWRKRVQGMLIQVDKLLAAPASPEDQRRWMAQRRELVDLLDPGVPIQWVATVPLQIVIV